MISNQVADIFCGENFNTSFEFERSLVWPVSKPDGFIVILQRTLQVAFSVARIAPIVEKASAKSG